MCRLLEEPLVSGNDPFWSSGKRRPPFRRLPFLSTGSEDAIIPVAIRARGGGGGGGGGGAYFAGAGGGAGEDLAALQHQRDGLHLDRRRLGVALGPQVGHQFRPHAQRLAPLLETGKKKKGQRFVTTVESGYIIHGYTIQPFILAIFGRNRIFTL